MDTTDNQEEKRKAADAISAMKCEYYNTLFHSLSFNGETWNMDGTSRNNFSFYACMTKKEILELTCAEDEAFYVFAAQFK